MSIHFFYPMAALVFFTFLYGIGMFFVRVRSVRSGQVDPRYFKLFNQGTPTDLVIKTGQHFTNLFEVPVLFYVVCLAFLALRIESSLALLLAWMFVGARLAQAYIHTTRNRLLPRILAFFAGVFLLMGMWVCLGLAVVRHS